MQLNGFPVERKKLSDLVPADYNPRRISEKDMKALKKSLKEFGVLEPILINKTTGNIVGGHQRLDALIAIGETETDVIICELSLEKEKAANIALNKISGEFDEDKLAAIFAEFQAMDFDLSLTGFDGEEIEKIFNGLATDNDINNPPASSYKEQYGVIVICVSEAEQAKVYEELRSGGYECRVVTT